ncbi:MAG: hypothetical protein GY765_34145, partial [bacterium]|nr:hypothetical protein [bacterium]
AAAGKIYKYGAGSWQEWETDSFTPNLFVRSIKADDDDIWFRASGKLVRYNGNFDVFSASDENDRLFDKIGTIIPFDGNGTYFSYSPYSGLSGLASFKQETWHNETIEVDTEKLPADPVEIAAGPGGEIWTATDNGLSKYTGTAGVFENDSIGRVFSVTTDPEGKTYALVEDAVLVIDGESKSTIPLDGFFNFENCIIRVDTNSRIWLREFIWEGSNFYYYDSNSSTWQDYGWIDAFITKTDQKGGLWLIQSAQEQLLHIKGDLSRV